MSHTPGPWLVRKLKSGFIIDSANYLTNVAGWPIPVCGGSGGVTREHDARLIAAAPELLAACQAALEYIEWLEDLADDSTADISAAYKACRRGCQCKSELRYAIARAKGHIS